MAGSGFTIDVREFSAAVRRLSDPELAEIASRAAADIVRGRAEGAFTQPPLRPAPWPPRKERQNKSGKPAKTKRKAHALMIDTGNLKGSFHVSRSGDGWKVASSAKYAPSHQYGTRLGTSKEMPPRPMLPFDAHGNLLPAAKEDVEIAMVQGVARMANRLGFTVK